MLEAALEASDHAKGRTRSDLDSDRQLVHSLVRCLEIIGEAASRVTPEFRETHPDIAWVDIIGMRNRLIHAYFDMNLNVVWRTVTEELSPLIAELQRLVNNREDE